MKIRILLGLTVVAMLGALAWGGLRLVRAASAVTATEMPSTRVRRGRVVMTVSARGELQGGKSEMLVVPPTGVDSTAITYLRDTGEMVEEGDVVAEFDTTLQEYNLREAQSDVAEAEQQVIQAKASSQATDEENQYTLASSKSAVTLAEITMRSNPVLSQLEVRDNQISLDAARGRLARAEQNLANRGATSAAGIAIQTANLNKAKVMADIAKRTIDSMTLKAKSSGYVGVQRSTSSIGYFGMILPPLQVGDTVYSGQAVAQIPDLSAWEVSAKVGELDRGHLAIGEPVSITVVALPGVAFPGHVKTLGATSGPAWDSQFECRIDLEKPSPELRPGMTTNMVITAEALDDVLWLPSQALFESDGRQLVYLRTDKGFMPHDVTLVKRSESQAVIGGLREGDVVAMSNPDQSSKGAQGTSQNGAMKALQK